MPKARTSVPHDLGRDEAARRLKDFVAEMNHDLAGELSDVYHAWEGHTLQFRFTAMGLKIRGQLAVEEEVAHFEGDLPLAAMIFKGRLERSVEEELVRLLG